MGFFDIFKKKYRSKIYELEIQDIKLGNEINTLTRKLQDHIAELKEILRSADFESKNAKLSEIQNNLILLKTKQEHLKEDLEKITAIELENKETISLNDQDTLEDKYQQVEALGKAIDELFDLTTANPSTMELRNIYDNIILNRMRNIILSINQMQRDDVTLEETYRKLEII